MDSGDYGIPGYRAEWLEGGLSLVHAERLAGSVGRRLTRAWLLWDLGADEWFADAPVVLDFEGERVEVNHQKFDELSITWNTIDLGAPAVWLGGDFRLAWRNDAVGELAALQGQVLRRAEPEVYRGAPGDMANGAVSVRFGFDGGSVLIFNALDENGLDFA